MDKYRLVPMIQTPIHFVEDDIGDNHIFMKREDMIPFSFGGNKVRFANAYLEDMQAKHADAMVIYGGPNSNLCRILTAVCNERNIPCAKVYNLDDESDEARARAESSINGALIRASGYRAYPCHRDGIADAVQNAMDDFHGEGKTPYYIYGNQFGAGNAHTPMKAYDHVYRELCRQEAEMGVRFDFLFLGSGTNTTQAGLLAGHLQAGDQRTIVGISTTRNQKRGTEVLFSDLEEYQDTEGVRYQLSAADEIHFTDAHLAGGYGCTNEGILHQIERMYLRHGIPLDGTYTGKAYCGMLSWLADEKIHDKNILFLHTGGAPLFMDLVRSGRIFA